MTRQVWGQDRPAPRRATVKETAPATSWWTEMGREGFTAYALSMQARQRNNPMGAPQESGQSGPKERY